MASDPRETDETGIHMAIPSELLSGYRRFRDERFAIEEGRYQALAHGQSPRTMIIGCADSRVDPATIFSAAPGELFVVRNVAALVPPCEEGGTYHGTSAALEFAVEGLRVDNIVVIGHGLCGGIAAALTPSESGPAGRFIQPWVGMLTPLRDELLEHAAEQPPEARQKALERMAVQFSLLNLTGFPFVQKAVDEGRLTLHGAWFSIAEGALHWLDWESGVFERVNERLALVGREPAVAAPAARRKPRSASG